MMENVTIKTFEDFMNKVSAVKFDEVATALGEISESSNLIEDYNGYLSVYACDRGLEIAQTIATKFKYNIATETIEDGESDNESYYGYDNSIRFVNRERFFFTRLFEDVSCCEVVEFGI